MLNTVTPNAQAKPFRKRIHNRNANAIDAPPYRVRILFELPARVQLRQDYLGPGYVGGRMAVGWDAASVVAHRRRAVGLQYDFDKIAVASQSFINRIVHNFE